MGIVEGNLAFTLWTKALLAAIAIAFAGAVVMLVLSFSTAATLTGRDPSLAISLASPVNTGILAPGEARWFRLRPAALDQAKQVEQSLTIFFLPDSESHGSRVSLQLFDEREVARFYQGNADRMANFGAGQPVSRDGNPQSGELLWHGWLMNQHSYFVQLVNDSEVAVDYWLLTADMPSYPLDQTNAPISEPPPAPAPIVGGAHPQAAIPLLAGQNKGHISPGQTVWYSFSLTDSDGDFFEEVALTMFATPNGQNQIDRLTFEIFTAGEAQRWNPKDRASIHNLGAGSLVRRDDNPLTGERFWTGWVVDNDLYFVQIHNGAGAPLDFWLFSGDVYHPQLDEASN